MSSRFNVKLVDNPDKKDLYSLIVLAIYGN